MKNKKIQIAIALVLLLLLPSITVIRCAEIGKETSTFCDYEKIFENKEPIHIVPINEFRTKIINKSCAIWSLETYELQNSTFTPVNDEDTKNFSYFAKPVYQMGLPDQDFATMITPEGYLYTGAAELEFFAGENLDPITQRIWTLYKEYLPCINYHIENDNVIFNIQAFQYWLEDEYNSPAINFIKIQVMNPAQTPVHTKLAVGFRHGGRDHRDFRMNICNHPFSQFWKYEMTNTSAMNGKKIIFLWDTPPSEKLQSLNKIYQKPFYCTDPQTSICFASYDIQLEGNETKNYTFKMPFYPLCVLRKVAVNTLKNAQYENYLEKMQLFWDGILAQGATIDIPEDKVRNASKSYIIANFMCQNITFENDIDQVTNRFQYNEPWGGDAFWFCTMYNFYNYSDISEKIIHSLIKSQNSDGTIDYQEGYWKQTAAALATFGNHVTMNNDTALAVKILPKVTKATDWIKKKVIHDRFGLIRAGNNKDGPFLAGHYTGDNFWALLGLYGAITVAKAAGNTSVSDDLQRFYDAYRNHFFKQLRNASLRNNGIIPPGMDVTGGEHWEDLLAAYQDNLLDPFDPLINNTLQDIRENHMIEGLVTHFDFLHHWKTEWVAQTSLRRDEQEQFLTDFYSMLLHTGSCHEGFEFCVFPSTRDYATTADLCTALYLGAGRYWCNFPNNAHFAAAFNILLRRMLLREENNSLHLFSAISPDWVKSGDVIDVKNASTYFGIVSLHAVSRDTGINITFKPIWREQPKSVILHMPFFANISVITVNGTPVSFHGGHLELPFVRCTINMSWSIDPNANYSYNKFVQDYIEGNEYNQIRTKKI